jgi:hypothetical protein
MGMSVPTYVELREGGGQVRHVGWLGWGQPACLTKAQAEQHARDLQAQGKCGALTPTKNLGYAVCDGEADACDGDHCDGRHQVVWTEGQ